MFFFCPTVDLDVASALLARSSLFWATEKLSISRLALSRAFRFPNLKKLKFFEQQITLDDWDDVWINTVRGLLPPNECSLWFVSVWMGKVHKETAREWLKGLISNSLQVWLNSIWRTFIHPSCRVNHLFYGWMAGEGEFKKGEWRVNQPFEGWTQNGWIHQV